MFQQDSDILSTCFSSLIAELESKELRALFLGWHIPFPVVAVQMLIVQSSSLFGHPPWPQVIGRCLNKMDPDTMGWSIRGVRLDALLRMGTELLGRQTR